MGEGTGTTELEIVVYKDSDGGPQVEVLTPEGQAPDCRGYFSMAASACAARNSAISR